ncbi:MAG: NAD-dependent epimerase/dehydratase family protein [Burkholderiales bacterium]|nr:NAD-dependent epimerase/dehydratase family protein [Burkholderiales bacterium]
MTQPTMKDQVILVTGGAGFVGSNLVKRLLELGAAKVHVVDNLLSAERVNVPDDPRVAFSETSITDDALLASLKDEYDYVFHLCTYHGNQSSIHDPIADHDNNTLTTLKLYERIKGFKRLRKVVYSSAGCSVAVKTFDTASATEETDIVALKQDSPYSMSKIFGEFYSVYYFSQHQVPTVRARFQNVYGPGEILGAGQWRGTPATVWRNVTPTFIFKALSREKLPLENEGIATRDFIYVTDVADGLTACAAQRPPGRSVQRCERQRDFDPRARGEDQRADRQHRRRPSSAQASVGQLGQALRQHREGRAGAGLQGAGRDRRGIEAHGRMDPAEPRPDQGHDREA